MWYRATGEWRYGRVCQTVLLAIAGFVAACASGSVTPGTRDDPRLANAPNVVLVLLDDLDLEAFPYMPLTRRHVTDSGATFTQSFVSTPLCCPSRVSLLRGQYATNTGVVANAGRNGGFGAARRLGVEQATLATYLQREGYRTALFGKYLNFYPARTDSAYVPPGWTRWGVPVGGRPYSGFDYTLNVDGAFVHKGSAAEDYGTDVYAGMSAAFIRESAAAHAPFFLLLSTFAPHAPATPAPRHRELFADARPPVTAATEERDFSDKPSFMRDLPPQLLPPMRAQADHLFRARLQSLQAVDEAVERLVHLLAELGELERTLIIVTSDNGFHLGAHGLPAGKETPYEEDIRVPLVMRGLGITPGTRIHQQVVNIDLAPTIAELAGASPDVPFDGRSLVPLLRGGVVDADTWRSGFLITRDLPEMRARQATPVASRERDPGGVPPVADAPELTDEGAGRGAAVGTGAGEIGASGGGAEGDAPSDGPAGSLSAGSDRVRDAARSDAAPKRTESASLRHAYGGIISYPSFRGVRTADGWSFVRHASGDEELYDLIRDPHQLDNLAAGDPPPAVQRRITRLREWLDLLASCKGKRCQQVEDRGPR